MKIFNKNYPYHNLNQTNRFPSRFLSRSNNFFVFPLNAWTKSKITKTQRVWIKGVDFCTSRWCIFFLYIIFARTKQRLVSIGKRFAAVYHSLDFLFGGVQKKPNIILIFWLWNTLFCKKRAQIFHLGLSREFSAREKIFLGMTYSAFCIKTLVDDNSKN